MGFGAGIELTLRVTAPADECSNGLRVLKVDIDKVAPEPERPIGRPSAAFPSG
jgi:hypothetical protein